MLESEIFNLHLLKMNNMERARNIIGSLKFFYFGTLVAYFNQKLRLIQLNARLRAIQAENAPRQPISSSRIVAIYDSHSYIYLSVVACSLHIRGHWKWPPLHRDM